MRAINITTILLLFQSFLANDGMAQAKELNVGDKVPEHLMKIVNSNSGEAKPTIINFWATWCVPCISELKLLDSVLNETDEINILSVTYEDEKTIKAFLEQNKDLKSGALSIISSDTLFKNYFPHRTLPHNVWIDPQNKVQNITGGDEMTRENIQSFSARAIIETQEKIDVLDFDPSKPFHLSDSRFVTRSILTDRISGILTGITVSRSGFADKKKIKRVFSYNQTLNSTLWQAVNKGLSPTNYYNTMRIETDDSLRFFSPTESPETFKLSNYASRHSWRKEHTYCYELRLPEYISDTVFYSYMLDDLKRSFNFEVEVIEDSILCSIISADNRTISAPNPNDSTILILDKDKLIAENVSVLSLFQFLNGTLKDNLNDIPADPPFIDRTGGVRISVKLDFQDGIPKYEYIKELIEKKYGIKVHHQKDRYKITIIKDMG